MCSDLKRLANQRHAQRRTGPKSDAGKERSRGNAWKHGLAGAGVVEPQEDRIRLEERVERWTEELKPRNAVEAWLIERAAKASVRLDRCVEKEALRIENWRGEAVDRWEKLAREWVTQTATELLQSPAATVEMLEKTVLGCDWIRTRWELLATSLETSTSWTAAECTLGVNLLGEVMNTASVANEAAAALRLNAFAARAERVPDQVDAFWGTSTKHLDPEARQQAIEASLPDRATAHTALSAIIAAEIARVEAFRDIAVEGEKAELTDAANRLSFDSLDDATLMRRYETAHSLDLHRCLSQLAKMRKLESINEPPAEAEIQPVVEPAAEPAAAPSEPVRNEPTAAATDGQGTGKVNRNGGRNGSNGRSGPSRNGSHKRSRGPKEVVETSAPVAAPV